MAPRPTAAILLAALLAGCLAPGVAPGSDGAPGDAPGFVARRGTSHASLEGACSPPVLDKDSSNCVGNSGWDAGYFDLEDNTSGLVLEAEWTAVGPPFERVQLAIMLDEIFIAYGTGESPLSIPLGQLHKGHYEVTVRPAAGGAGAYDQEVQWVVKRAEAGSV